MSARAAPAWQAALAVLAGAAATPPAHAVEFSGSVAFEGRRFLASPAERRQRHGDFSLVAEPELYHEWDDGDQSVLFVPFARIDSVDAERTHVDVRELRYQRVGDDWELRVGIGKVFWGVTESRHLVDVVNQIDAVENVDGEDKLGQPMVELALIRDWGTLDLFVLPGFRERTFPGREGRLRTSPPVETDRAEYESSAGRAHVDLAARWTHVLGDVDIGVSHFWGTSRDPTLIPIADAGGAVRLIPRYEIVHQTGLELQATIDAWLWKLELVRRSGQGPSHLSWVGGFEYTLFGIGGGVADLGLLVEHLFDSRGGNAPQPFENDVFAGARLAFNDVQSTEVLAGFIHDLEGDATVYSVEASRRLGDSWKLALEARIWSAIRAGDPAFALRRDDQVRLGLSYFF